MTCCLTIVSLAFPRLVLFVVCVFTRYPHQVWDRWLWPILGFVFLPYTTLAYMGAVVRRGSVEGWWILLLVFALILDLGSSGSASRRRT